MTVSRRNVLGGALAAGLVYAFDPARRSWVGEATASRGARPVPPLDGTLRADPASLAAAADDFGHIRHQTPLAVLAPGSVDDIAKMVRYARRNELTITMRGQGHSTYGQAQALGGIVVDSTTLARIGRIHPDRVTVDAGVTWADVLRATFAEGLTPPVLTDYLELSVGGTLSLGGIGGAASRHGAQIDNVLELEVVTGRGERETCSRTRNPGLFDAVLGGMGQFALITKATLALVPARPNVTVYNLVYTDLAAYVADQRRLLADGRFDYLEGSVASTPAGGWEYVVEAASFHEAAEPSSELPAGLADDGARRTRIDQGYLDFAFRIEPLVALLTALGLWATPHPWYGCFVPASRAVEYVGGLLAGLTVADTGGGPILFYPFDRRRLQRPALRVPDEDFFAFNLLRFPADPAAVPVQVAQNRGYYEDLVAVGGTLYPLGSVPMGPRDWLRQYGRAYPVLAAAKVRFDPDSVLTPGPEIYPLPCRD